MYKDSNKLIIIICLLSFIPTIVQPKVTISNHHGPSQLGDRIVAFAVAKVLALKYPDKVEFFYSPFGYGELFKFDEVETHIKVNDSSQNVFIWNENEIDKYLAKQNCPILKTHVATILNDIDPQIVNAVKQEIKLKTKPMIDEIPQDKISVAVHIRKGNGGGEVYDGELASIQLYDFDRSKVTYVHDYQGTPFDWETYDPHEQFDIYKPDPSKWYIDYARAYMTKNPPEQYYVDQIRKLSSELGHVPLYIQLFTDDKNPAALLERIKKAVNLPNVDVHYQDNKTAPFKDRLAQDMYAMTMCDVFIRSQSYFARAVELMGNFKLVMYPLDCRWEKTILIMTKIAVKGSIQELKIAKGV